MTSRQPRGHLWSGQVLAAQYHGAAHHRAQEFQAVVAKSRRPIRCGKVRAAFMVHKHIHEAPVQAFNTPRGTILVSTPEATAVDLIGCHHHAGGLDHVAALFSALAEAIDPHNLVTAARTAPFPWGQRLGILLEHAGVGEKAAALKSFVKGAAPKTVLLLTGTDAEGARRDRGWKLLINTDLEPEV